MDEDQVADMLLAVIDGIENAGGSRNVTLSGILRALVSLVKDSDAEEEVLLTAIPSMRAHLAASSYDKFRHSRSIH